MIRIALATIGSLIAVTLYRVADLYSIHTAWLMLLAFGSGLAFGVVFWLEFGYVGVEEATNEPLVTRKR